MPKEKASAANSQLDAPIALPADQLELVAGGLTLAKIGVIGPTNGLWQVVKLPSVGQISLPSQVAM